MSCHQGLISFIRPYIIANRRRHAQRVVNSKGIISPRGDFGLGVARQKERLEDEGVEVETLAGAGGERVDLRRWGWFPETLPQDGEE